MALALAEGATARDIAADTQQAESTVRELTKRIHIQLGISRWADLVRCVLSVPASPVPVPDPRPSAADAAPREKLFSSW